MNIRNLKSIISKSFFTVVIATCFAFCTQGQSGADKESKMQESQMEPMSPDSAEMDKMSNDTMSHEKMDKMSEDKMEKDSVKM